MYAGDFCYKNNTKLLSLTPFLHVQDTTNLPKNTNCQPEEKEIIKIGTKIEIMELKYDHKAKESYLLVKVAKERGNVSFFKDDSYIFMIPTDFSNKNQIKEYLNNYFINNDPNKWLLLQQEYIQKAIFNKYPVFGMTKEQLKATLGLAVNIEKMQKSSLNEEQEIWTYADYLIIFAKEQIIKITKI